MAGPNLVLCIIFFLIAIFFVQVSTMSSMQGGATHHALSSLSSYTSAPPLPPLKAGVGEVPPGSELDCTEQGGGGGYHHNDKTTNPWKYQSFQVL